MRMFEAKMTARPKGEQIGWVALYKNSNKRDWFRNPSKEFATAMFNTGRYEWVRGLFFDGIEYGIGA